MVASRPNGNNHNQVSRTTCHTIMGSLACSCLRAARGRRKAGVATLYARPFTSNHRGNHLANVARPVHDFPPRQAAASLPEDATLNFKVSPEGTGHTVRAYSAI